MTAALIAVAVGLCSATLAAQTFRGSGTCAGSECHAKNGETQWLNEKPGGKEHRASYGKMRAARENSEKYAKAVNLASFSDPKGMCVKCHAMYVEKAATLEGVGCEGCHGPASGYLDFHSKNPKDYPGAVKVGMRDILRHPERWTQTCRDCHVLSDKPEYDALIEAGHKDNARWNVSTKFVPVAAHWGPQAPKYAAADILAAVKGARPAVSATATPTPTASTPPAPPPTPPVTTPPVTTPPVTTPTPPPSVTTTPPPATTAARNPIDPTKPPKGGKPTVVAPPPTPTPTPTPVVPPAVPATPMPPPVSSPLGLTPPPPTTSAGMFAALQNRISGLLESLLRKNVTPPAPLSPPIFTPQAAGPDAELLRLQSEALALAVEALNLKVQTSGGTKPPQP